MSRPKQVTPEDVGRVISGCLNHRLRKYPLNRIDSRKTGPNF